MVLTTIFRATAPSLREMNPQYLQIIALFGCIVVNIVTSIFLPIFVISRNQNLKNCIENTLNNMLPVIYVPDFIANINNTNRPIDVNVWNKLNMKTNTKMSQWAFQVQDMKAHFWKHFATNLSSVSAAMSPTAAIECKKFPQNREKKVFLNAHMHFLCVVKGTFFSGCAKCLHVTICPYYPKPWKCTFCGTQRLCFHFKSQQQLFSCHQQGVSRSDVEVTCSVFIKVACKAVVSFPV